MPQYQPATLIRQDLDAVAHCEASQLEEALKLCVRPGVKQKIAFIALFLFLSSCAVSQVTDSPVITPSKPDYVSYLRMVQNKIQSNRKFPSGVSGTQAVTLRFVVDIDGKLVSVEVVKSTDARLNGPAMEAMSLASPFPSIPENFKKLAGEPMVIKFAVSTRPRESP